MKTDRLIVVARMIGTYGIILGYFVTLHVSTLFGAMLNVVFELLALPFYICLLYTSPSPRDRG